MAELGDDKIHPSRVEAPSREEIAEHLRAITAQCTTAATSAMDERHDWFHQLDPDHRSWITVVARAGIDGFIEWYSGAAEINPMAVFDTAPRLLMRKVSLHQTVELVRTTIEVFEERVKQLLPAEETEILTPSMFLYSREIAFAAASVYAHAAEIRGAWDARLESLVVDAIMRGEADETVISRASTLGWRSADAVIVIIGNAATDAPLDEVRRRSAKAGFDALIAPQGDRLILIISGPTLVDTETSLKVATNLSDAFAPGPIVIGPIVDHLVEAATSARAALSGLRATPAWPEGQRILSANELLPERALCGDSEAQQELVRSIFQPLSGTNGDLLSTAVSFLDNYGSVEGTARALFVHPNTVRYRLKRIQEVTGYSLTDAREAFIVRIGISLGRLELP